MRSDIIAAIQAGKEEIILNKSDGDLVSYIINNPKLHVKVRSIRTTYSFNKVIYRLQYQFLDIPDENIIIVDNLFQAEKEFLECISRFKRQAVFITLKGKVNMYSIENTFDLAYMGFYYNLLNKNCVSAFSSSKYDFYIYQFIYRLGSYKLNSMEREVNKKIEELIPKLFTPDMSKELKAYIAHNYLASTITYYNNDNANVVERSYIQTAYGALINQKCVCQGYAEAYKRILDRLGITCEVLCGKMKGENSYHAWNIVSFNEKDYYQVDVTWDSIGGGRVSYEYFCKSDKFISQTRYWTRKYDWVCMNEKDIRSVAIREINLNKHKYISKGLLMQYIK